MSRAPFITVGLILGMGLSMHSVAGQVVTGPETNRKNATSATEGVLDAPVGPEWTAWGEDEAVARWIYEPIKLLGLGSFGPEGRVELKSVVSRAEGRIRSTVRALSVDEIAADAATQSVEEALVEFRAAVTELLEVRQS